MEYFILAKQNGHKAGYFPPRVQFFETFGIFAFTSTFFGNIYKF